MASLKLLKIFTVVIAMQLFTFSTQIALAEENTDIYSGYYSRDRGDGKAARIAGQSQYIKFYPDHWVVMLYIPYDYSLNLSPDDIRAALADIKSQATSKSYFKDKFGPLTEISVAHVEIFENMDAGQIEFECDGTAPCRVRFKGDKMEVRKTGMLSDHIIAYSRVK